MAQQQVILKGIKLVGQQILSWLAPNINGIPRVVAIYAEYLKRRGDKVSVMTYYNF